METTAPLRSKRGIWPAIGLIFVAPLVAEFLLGNLPIKFLAALVLLAPMYGGGALLIREVARRSERGWPSIVILALAYGVIEEAYTTQSLFNPNYLKLNLHLLQAAYIPALGIGAWWTVFVLTLHTAWSISTSIALVEAAVPERAETPWLGNIGLGVTALLFALGTAAGTLMQLHRDPFVATRGQLLTSGAICIALIVVAFMLPRRSAATEAGAALNPWIIGALGLVAGGAVLVVPSRWNWWAAAAIAGIDLAVFFAVWLWSRRDGWNLLHKLALAGGAALAYGIHAFIETPVISGAIVVTRIGNAIFFLGAISLIGFAGMRAAEWMESLRPKARE